MQIVVKGMDLRIETRDEGDSNGVVSVQKMRVQAPELVIDAPVVRIKGDLIVEGTVTHQGLIGGGGE